MDHIHKKKMLILGFGDLGHVLVKEFGEVYAVRGIKRSHLSNPPCPVFYQSIQDPQLAGHLKWADSVVFCPAPSRDESSRYRSVYLENMESLLSRLKSGTFPVSLIVYIASTGIYPNAPDREWTEESPITPGSEKQEVLLRTETVLTQSGLPYVIFRCGGLYGEGKGRFRERLAQGKITTSMMTKQFVHFIHLRDVSRAVRMSMEKGVSREKLNTVDDSRIRRKDFYRFLSDWYRLPIPDDGPPPTDVPDRRISNEKIKRILNFRFSSPNILNHLRADPPGV